MNDTKYGYDPETGCLMSLDRNDELTDEGVLQYPPLEALKTQNRIEATLEGCINLSSWKGYNVAIFSDGNKRKLFLTHLSEELFVYIPIQDFIPNKFPICVCGDIVRHPDKMMDLCAEYPCSMIYACPIVEELPSIGILVSSNKHKGGRRYPLAWENNNPVNAECRKFDPKLDGDGMGRMADLVANNLLPVNEYKTALGVSSFYGKILHKEWMEESVCIVRMTDMDRLFPNTPVSAKNYAATSVPVKMETTSQFREEAGYNKSDVEVFVSTDYLPDCATFMRFYKTFSGKSFVWASDMDKIDHKPIIPVFRHNGAYRVKREEY